MWLFQGVFLFCVMSHLVYEDVLFECKVCHVVCLLPDACVFWHFVPSSLAWSVLWLLCLTIHDMTYKPCSSHNAACLHYKDFVGSCSDIMNNKQ